LTLTVTNLLGQKIVEINEGNVGAGKHDITIDGSTFTSGIYFYTVKAGENTMTKKMMVE